MAKTMGAQAKEAATTSVAQVKEAAKQLPDDPLKDLPPWLANELKNGLKMGDAAHNFAGTEAVVKSANFNLTSAQKETAKALAQRQQAAGQVAVAQNAVKLATAAVAQKPTTKALEEQKRAAAQAASANLALKDATAAVDQAQQKEGNAKIALQKAQAAFDKASAAASDLLVKAKQAK